MENELDLTLRLGLASPTVGTHLSSLTPTTHQGINDAAGDRRDDNNNNGDGEINLRRFVGDDVVINDNEGARNNIDINLRVYNYVFQKFAGIGETLNFAPYPMPPSPAPAPVTPTGNDYVLIDVPARRAQRNKALTLANAPEANAPDANADALDANANAKGRHGYGFCGGCGRMDDGMIKCTNRNCNAITTPMWRRGPLGPKTLCNACGIKYRKEEERKSKSKSN